MSFGQIEDQLRSLRENVKELDLSTLAATESQEELYQFPHQPFPRRFPTLDFGDEPPSAACPCAPAVLSKVEALRAEVEDLRRFLLADARARLN